MSTITANKNGKFQIKEEDKGFYHLHVVENFQTELGRPQILQGRIVLLSKIDFKKYLENKKIFNFVSEEIIHDPTHLEHANQVAETAGTPPLKVKIDDEKKSKQKGYFGGPEWRAKQEEKKSQTTN